MSRGKRIIGNSGIYHIIIRGNDRQNIFIDDEDRMLLINRIEKYSSELQIEVYAYCLMNNHVHMLIGEANEKLSKFMLKLNTSYARLFNIKYERCGHLFQGRFLSNPIENDDSFRKIIVYIYNNPEKAGIGNYDEYIWSSFQEIIQEKESNFTRVKKVIELFGEFDNLIECIRKQLTDNCMDYESKYRMNDKKCCCLIKKRLRINDPGELKRMDIKELKKKLKLLEGFSISQNQLARLTGISRGFIRKNMVSN
ncbi:MAG: transposase [Treponema sp.]|nr:transposase [Treponema sp.]